MLADMGWTIPLDVSVEKQVVGGGAGLAPNDPVTMTLSISNSGPILATGVVVTDTLSTDIVGPSYGTSTVITDTGAPDYVWTVSNLPPGASEVITIYGTISPTLPAAFAIVNTASISSAEDDDETGNNTSTAILGGEQVYLPLVLRDY